MSNNNLNKRLKVWTKSVQILTVVFLNYNNSSINAFFQESDDNSDATTDESSGEWSSCVVTEDDAIESLTKKVRVSEITVRIIRT